MEIDKHIQARVCGCQLVEQINSLTFPGYSRSIILCYSLFVLFFNSPILVRLVVLVVVIFIIFFNK